jgi:hypothetical protein
MSKIMNEKFGQQFLDDIIDWIKSNYTPEDIFDRDVLQERAAEWARAQIEWIPDPDEWAAENGYEKV